MSGSGGAVTGGATPLTSGGNGGAVVGCGAGALVIVVGSTPPVNAETVEGFCCAAKYASTPPCEPIIRFVCAVALAIPRSLPARGLSGLKPREISSCLTISCAVAFGCGAGAFVIDVGSTVGCGAGALNIVDGAGVGCGAGALNIVDGAGVGCGAGALYIVDGAGVGCATGAFVILLGAGGGGGGGGGGGTLSACDAGI